MRRLIWVFACRTYHIVVNLMSRLICGRLFSKAQRCTWRLAFGSSLYHAMTLRYKNCDVTSWGSHSRLLERAIVNVQAPGDRKNPSVLWLKHKLNINKTGILWIHFYFLYFFNVNDDHGTFFKSRIRFLVRSNRFRIDTGTLFWQNGNQAFI